MNTAARAVVYAMIAILFVGLIALIVFAWAGKEPPKVLEGFVTGDFAFLTGILAKTGYDASHPPKEETP